MLRWICLRIGLTIIELARLIGMEKSIGSFMGVPGSGHVCRGWAVVFSVWWATLKKPTLCWKKNIVILDPYRLLSIASGSVVSFYYGVPCYYSALLATTWVSNCGLHAKREAGRGSRRSGVAGAGWGGGVIHSSLFDVALLSGLCFFLKN